MTEHKKLSEITHQEMIDSWWIDVTIPSEHERVYIKGRQRTPLERAMIADKLDEMFPEEKRRE